MVAAPSRYLSVCSGIEAFTVAVRDLDFEPAAFAEVEPFPCQVLHHHYGSGRPEKLPDAKMAKAVSKVPARRDGAPRNLGDMTQIDTGTLGRVDWLVGGTPCQSFSVAGLRQGLDDERGNLALEYVRLAHRLADGNGLRGLLWENVFGVLSDRTNAFGCLLGGLVGHDAPLVTPHGDRWPDTGMVAGPRARVAWRVLNSQHLGVPQRRRRVYLVADFGNGPDPAAVLFEPRGQGWRAAPGGKAEQGSAGATGPGVAHALRAKSNLAAREDADTFVTHALTGECFDASEEGTGRGTPIVATYLGNAEGGNAEAPSLNASNGKKGINNQTALVAVFDPNQITNPDNGSQPAEELAHSLPAQSNAPVLFGFGSKGSGLDASDDLSPTLRASGHSGSHANGGSPPAIAFHSQASAAQSMNPSEISPSLDKSKMAAVAFNLRGREGGNMPELGTDQASALRSADGGSSAPMALTGPQVRRLTPTECSRLQGFPDSYLDIPGLSGWRDLGDDEDADALKASGMEVRRTKSGKWRVNDPDGPKYKSLGNSFTTETINWIMSRVQASLRGEPMPDWQPLQLWRHGPWRYK